VARDSSGIGAIVDDIVAALLPGRCPCGARGEPCCARCAETMRAAPHAAPPVGVDWWVAPYAYEGVARELVARAKYRTARAPLAWLGAAVASSCPPNAVIDLVTWAPASTERTRAHGVDHAQLLARAVARRIGRPVRGLLVRSGGSAQTGALLDDRRRGPALRACAPLRGAHVLVVDDVATTGATLTAAAAALRRAGAVSVAAATATRTPHPGHG